MVGAVSLRGLRVAGWFGFLVLPTAAIAQATSEPVELRAAIEPGAYIQIWSGGGSVNVVGWDQDSLVVSGARTPGPGRFFSRLHPGAAKIGFEVLDLLPGDIDARLEVRVPRQSTVWVKVLDAAVVVHDFEGSLDVFAVTGRIEVDGSPRTLQAESMAGRIELELDDSQVVRAKTGTGDVTFRGHAVDLTLRSISGSINVDGASPRRTQLESVDGNVRYRGGVAKGGALTADTHSGDIDLFWDESVSAGVDLVTVEGRIRSPFPNEAPDRRVPGERVFFELGTGAAEIRVRSFSGDITASPRSDEGGNDLRLLGDPTFLTTVPASTFDLCFPATNRIGQRARACARVARMRARSTTGADRGSFSAPAT